MDRAPYRASQAAARSTARPTAPQEPSAASAHHAAVETRPTSVTKSKEPKSRKPLMKILMIAAIVAVLAVGGWFAWSKLAGGSLGIDSGKYQAVFFTNGQVYFGKLTMINGDYMKLTDIYYLQTQESSDSDNDSKNPQQTSGDQGNVQLIKLGNEVHGPEDEMIISRDQVLFFENLKADGKVAQTIAGSKK